VPPTLPLERGTRLDMGAHLRLENGETGLEGALAANKEDSRIGGYVCGEGKDVTISGEQIRFRVGAVVHGCKTFKN